MALTLRITRLLQHPPRGTYLQWTVDGITPQMSGDWEFHVDRSYNMGGPWTAISPKLTNRWAFFDTLDTPAAPSYANFKPPSQLGFHRTFYYRVRVKGPTGEETFAVQSPAGFMDPKMAGYARRMRHRAEDALKYPGTEVALFKRRLWGRRCTQCVDKVTKMATQASCRVCYGTSFVGGFSDPVQIRAKRGPVRKNSQPTPNQREDASGTQVTCPYSPLVDPGDVLVFIREGSRWLVEGLGQTEIQMNVVHQTLECVEIQRASILYQLPLPNDPLTTVADWGSL